MRYEDRQAAIGRGLQSPARLAPLIGTVQFGKTVRFIGGYGRDGAERLDFDDNTARWITSDEIDALLANAPAAD